MLPPNPMKSLFLAVTLFAGAVFAQVTATAQTPPIPSGVTAANDTAIWVHPTDVARSLVFCTDGLGTGLYAYGLDGMFRQNLPIGNTRAVDVGYNVPFGGKATDVVLTVAVNGAFRLWAPDHDAGALTTLNTADTLLGSNANAAALSVDPDAGLTVFISDMIGTVSEFRVTDDGAGHLVPSLRRSLTLPAPVQGIAADDRGKRVFVTLLNQGLFFLSNEADGGTSLTTVEGADAGHLAGAQGVAVYATADGGGYVIASATQASTFAVYALSTGLPFVTSFTVVADAGIGGATSTQGIDVVPISLGAPFTTGLFIAHDAPVGNYKLINWSGIANASTPALAIDTSVDPRVAAVGSDAGTPMDGGAGGGGGSSSSNFGGKIRSGTGKLPPVEVTGCNCSSGGLLAPLAALAWLLRRRKAQTRAHRTE